MSLSKSFPSPIPHIKQWLIHCRSVNLARRELLRVSGEERAGLVARSLWAMNRYAYAHKHTPLSDLIYRLKDMAIEHFYLAGFCRSTTWHVQIKRCYYCTDGETGYGHECDHCDGTGVYSRHYLMCLSFLIDGEPFSWHIPATRWYYWMNDIPATNTRETAIEWQNTSDPYYRIGLGLYPLLVQVYLSWYGLWRMTVWSEYARQYLLSLKDYLDGIAWGVRRRLALRLYPSYANYETYYNGEYANDDDDQRDTIPF